ncbi:MAG TPA: CHRD domain-containing protein [Thermoanaerobaculia bacterium]|nr:CHRD domain-containing protein [Thermoanaerobaculia bacterium]
MRTHLRLLVVAHIVTLTLFGPALLAQQVPLVFDAALTGGNIVGGSGSQNGFANATLTIIGTQATLDVATIGLTGITGVALYVGAPGTNGTVIQAFTDANNGFVNGRFNRTLPLDPGVIGQIATNTQNFYIVVTTSANPGGAVRGTLTNANAVYLAGRISGNSSLCNGGNGTAGGVGAFVLGLTPDAGGATYTLRYDLVTSGLGNTLSALEIGDNLGGSGPITVGTNVSGTNGRFAGTVQIAAARAQAVQSLPNGIRFTVRTPDSGAACAAAGAPQAAHEIVIPVAGSVRGAGSTNYMTDLNVYNNAPAGGTGNTDVLVQFFPAGAGTATAQYVGWTTLLPRGMAGYRDIATSAFDAQINGIGALRLVTAGNIFANARIYNNQIANGGGTFGQFVGGLPRTVALTEGTLVGLSNIVSGAPVGGSASARTNIGFFNASDNAATAAFELLDANGTVIGTRTLTINAWQQLQLPLIGGLFTGINGDVNLSSVHFLSGGPLFVYASIVDNVSGDGSYVTPGINSSGGTS